jgi:N-acetylglutamate synthase-like GNAT family acetyltransferase
MQLQFQLFNTTHLPEYKKWFKDPEIKRYLGDVDEEWLKYVETKANQLEFAVFHDDRMVGEIGIVLPIEEEAYNVITNLAVNPLYRSRGIGKMILSQALKLDIADLSIHWVAFVEPLNWKARKLFSQSGWDKTPAEEADDMIRFEIRFP